LVKDFFGVVKTKFYVKSMKFKMVQYGVQIHQIFIIFYENESIKHSCHRRIQIFDLWVNEFKYDIKNMKFKMAPIWQLLTLKFIIFYKNVLKQSSFHY